MSFTSVVLLLLMITFNVAPTPADETSNPQESHPPATPQDPPGGPDKEASQEATKDQEQGEAKQVATEVQSKDQEMRGTTAQDDTSKDEDDDWEKREVFAYTRPPKCKGEIKVQHDFIAEDTEVKEEARMTSYTIECTALVAIFTERQHLLAVYEMSADHHCTEARCDNVNVDAEATFLGLKRKGKSSLVPDDKEDLLTTKASKVLVKPQTNLVKHVSNLMTVTMVIRRNVIKKTLLAILGKQISERLKANSEQMKAEANKNVTEGAKKPEGGSNPGEESPSDPSGESNQDTGNESESDHDAEESTTDPAKQSSSDPAKQSTSI